MLVLVKELADTAHASANLFTKAIHLIVSLSPKHIHLLVYISASSFHSVYCPIT